MLTEQNFAKHLCNVHSFVPTLWLHDTHCVSHAFCWSLFALIQMYQSTQTFLAKSYFEIL